ncbi:MAG: hypothetical protein ACR2JG_00485 [Geodermatophilaceae bacterium]
MTTSESGLGRARSTVFSRHPRISMLSRAGLALGCAMMLVAAGGCATTQPDTPTSDEGGATPTTPTTQHHHEHASAGDPRAAVP